MSKKKVVSYVREQLQKGFDLKTIKNHLIGYGYKDYEVDDAINEIYRPNEVKHIIHFSPATLITIVSIFLGLIIISGVVFFFFSSNEPQQLLDLNLEPVKSTVQAGEDIVFIADILNLGSKNRYDIFLKHELISSKSNKVVTFKEQTRGIETTGSNRVNLKVPDDAESGNYILRSIATFNGNRAVATLQVKVEGEEKSEKPEEEIPIEETKTEETPEDEKPKVIVPIIKPIKDSALEGLTSYEALEKIKGIAETDVEKAASLCQTLTLQTSKDLCLNNIGEIAEDERYCTLIIDERTKDICFSNVARILEKSIICESISKESRKDSCYMNFVVDFQDYTVCDKVNNQYLRQSCNSLKQLSELNETDLSFYQAFINQTLLSLDFS